MLKLEAGAFCEDIGLRVLNKSEVQYTVTDYREQLLSGLRGDVSALAMFPSRLHPVGLGSLRERNVALVAEIGDTNVYGAKVEIRNGEPIVISAHQSRLPTKIYEDPAHFYHSIAKEVQHLTQGVNPDAIGIVYSFPGSVVKTSTGIDVTSDEELPKGFVIPGISLTPVGQGFRRALSRLQGVTLDDVPVAVLNDTVAVLFSVGARMGSVVGTGFNIATATEQGIVNTESGGYKIGFSNKLVDIIDLRSPHPGMYSSEKQIGGLYLGQQMAEAARMVAERLGLVIDTKSVTAATISEVLEGRRMGPEVEVLGEVARRLRDRSAQIVGIMMGTIASTFPEVFHESEVVVPVEGSVFWGIPDYHSIVARVANETSGGKRFEFVNVENAGRIGAAVAALSMVR